MSLPLFDATPATFDLNESRKARDAGIALVIGHNETWLDVFVRFVASQPCGLLVTGEDLRRMYLGPQPKHHNAWGGAILACVRKGLLVKTGRYHQMKYKQSHARVNPEYERTSRL